MARAGETELIARYLAPLATDPAAFALTDDAAALSVPDNFDLVLTADALVAGVHFFPDDPPGLIARKALRTNLSDLAAKGASPRGYLLTLALPDNWTEEWLAAFVGGLALDQKQFGLPLLGGDTTRAGGPLTLSITALGLVARGKMVRRSGAVVGDKVFVTGTIGDSALGCLLRLSPQTGRDLAAAHREFLLQRYLLPEPRNVFSAPLLAYASAAMDISDGLAGDLAKLCAVSKVTAAIDIGQVPLSAAAAGLIAEDEILLKRALTGGDDYEILFTARPDHCDMLMAAAREANIAIHSIGTILDGAGVPRFSYRGRNVELGALSYSHF